VGTSSGHYRRLRRDGICVRCRRRRARTGKTKCAVCARALKVTDALGARRRKYGASADDVQRLINNQDGKCFCGKPVDHSGALDHEWKTRDLRGVLCPPHNSVIGRTDAELFAFAHGVGQYASQRRLVLIHRRCVEMSKAA
jgi:hypothetical protein